MGKGTGRYVLTFTPALGLASLVALVALLVWPRLLGALGLLLFGGMGRGASVVGVVCAVARLRHPPGDLEAVLVPHILSSTAATCSFSRALPIMRPEECLLHQGSLHICLLNPLHCILLT